MGDWISQRPSLPTLAVLIYPIGERGRIRGMSHFAYLLHLSVDYHGFIFVVYLNPMLETNSAG
jgi:hypothetical protein